MGAHQKGIQLWQFNSADIHVSKNYILMIWNLPINQLMAMHYIISSLMLNSPHTSLTLQKSMFAKSVSPLLNSFPFNLNVISSYFTSPFHLRESDNCISSSSPNDSLIQQSCIYSKQIQLNNLI